MTRAFGAFDCKASVWQRTMANQFFAALTSGAPHFEFKSSRRREGKTFAMAACAAWLLCEAGTGKKLTAVVQNRREMEHALNIVSAMVLHVYGADLTYDQRSKCLSGAVLGAPVRLSASTEWDLRRVDVRGKVPHPDDHLLFNLGHVSFRPTSCIFVF